MDVDLDSGGEGDDVGRGDRQQKKELSGRVEKQMSVVGSRRDLLKFFFSFLLSSFSSFPFLFFFFSFSSVEVFMVDSNDSGLGWVTDLSATGECGAIVPKAAMEWNEPVVCGREP
ncbi:hypothetical protein BDV26DRAFT_116708 [Aspergillus bertholletiae]|uniref:Uncharacterized protein n=1 Tax=Aspergillus bertholletiae TaxID=1226010 RepID=A0A5N7APL5_9EURO|nr:hypothetical protein BDV26DRAFT_116708 [Aspergillus bertholletiae]